MTTTSQQVVFDVNLFSGWRYAGFDETALIPDVATAAPPA
jgi:hypothetical protein